VPAARRRDGVAVLAQALPQQRRHPRLVFGQQDAHEPILPQAKGSGASSANLQLAVLQSSWRVF
jgi:hypothetical protein